MKKQPMLKQILNKLCLLDASARSTKVFTKQRRFTHERLEPRMMMTINPSGADFLVNDIVSGFQGIEENVSSVAVSEAAGTIAAYAGLGAGERESIFLRRFDSSNPTQVTADRVSSTIRGTRADAAVAANDDGLSVVVWQGRGAGDKHGIFMQRYDAAGAKVGSEQLVNQTIAGKQKDPSVSMAGDGSFVIAWSGPSSDDSSGIYARRYSADGTALSDEELVNTTTAGLQIEGEVSVNSGGDYVITWSSLDQDGDDWAIVGQRFNASGVRQGDEFMVNTTAAASQSESSVAMQDDGTFMVVWSSFGQDGSSWAVVGQRFDAAGTAVGDEFIVNTTTAGHQRHAQVAGAQGKYLVTWQSGVADGSGWEIMAQEFSGDGTRVGGEQAVNSVDQGANSGHQQHPAVAFSSTGDGAVIWSGQGSSDRRGVYGRQYTDDGTTTDPNLTPDLATIADQTVAPGVELSVTVTATDPNAGDTLTYQLDPNHSPAGATIERTDNNTAVIRWTPTSAEASSVVEFRVLVTDDGEPPLSDAEEFHVTVTDGSITLDLNGADEAGADEVATFFVGDGAVEIVDDDLIIVGAADGLVSRTSIQLAAAPNGSQEVLAVDTLDTNITATYTVGLRRLLLEGVDTAENYERVLRTLTYNNTASNASGTRTVRVQVNDASRLSNRPEVTITLSETPVDLVAFAQALTDSGATFFGAGWCPHCTDQKELFGDGAQFLPFVEVTNPDRTQNSVGAANNISTFPTWVFADDTRLEGAQSLETLAARAGITIPLSADPFIAPLANETLLAGSPLHIGLDGYDPKGGPLTYTVSTDNGAVEATILSGNRSARVDVAGYGDMVFELFEQRATRATDRFIELANEDFYDGLSFHRILDDFVIQGGDPNGNGTGGSTKGDFDDIFHVDLQHNRTGLLSYAKSGDDTNDSQFFITEGKTSTRHLDFNHSIFGVLVEGESNRAAISDTEANGSGVSTFDINMETVEIFQDNENAVLMLKAAPGTTGDVTVTVTATDSLGRTFDRTFVVTVAEDTVNGNPFLDDIIEPTIVKNTSAQIQLTATDVEGDAVVFRAFSSGTVNYTFDVTDSGLLTVTPPTDFVGTLEIEVQVLAQNSTVFDSQLVSILVTETS